MQCDIPRREFKSTMQDAAWCDLRDETAAAVVAGGPEPPAQAPQVLTQARTV
jgi:hypothetical protein